MQFNWLDVLIAAVLLISTGLGFSKGFLRVGIGLASTIFAVVGGLWLYGTAGSFLAPYFSSPALANFVGFLLVCLGIIVLGALLARLLAYVFRWAGLTWLDRLAGALFGCLRGLVLAIALVMALLAFSPQPPPQSVVDSYLGPYVIEASHYLARMAPRSLQDGFADSYKKVRKAWADMHKKRHRRLPEQQL